MAILVSAHETSRNQRAAACRALFVIFQLFANQINFVGPPTRFTFVLKPGFDLGIPDKLIPCFFIR